MTHFLTGSASAKARIRALDCLLGMVLLAGSAAFAQQASPAAARTMHDAVAAAERGDEPKALRLVTALLDEEPAFVPALKLQAVLLEDSGARPEAAKVYLRALALAPADAELQLKVGVVKLLGGDNAGAVALLQKHTAAQPQDEEGFFYLAQAYHREGEDAQALAAIRQAAQLAPTSGPILQKYGELLCSSGDCTQAVDVLKMAGQQEAHLPRLDYDLAFASFSNQDLEQSVAYAEAAIAQQPGDVDAFALLGSARVKLGQWQEAEPVLEHVLAARPGDSAVLLQLGHCQLELKQYSPAIASLEGSLRADPTQALAHFFLARAYAAQGHREQARHESDLHAHMMQEFSFEVPKSAQQHEAALTEQARRLLADHKEAAAVHLFEVDSLQAHGTPAQAWLGVGATYLHMNDVAASQRALHKALELDPTVKGAYTYLGFIALQQDNLPVAEQAFQAELKGDPNHPEALAELGEVRYRQGRWDEAAQALVRSKSATPRFLFMLTDCYFHLGKIEAANLTAESLAAHAHDQPAILVSLKELLTRNGQMELAGKIGAPAA